MKISTPMVGVAALATIYLATFASAQDQQIPWDGRGTDLNVEDLSKKYLLHILKMRKNKMDGKPTDYVTITQNARPSYNDDASVITVAVDADAIFQSQNNFRRSELVQNIANNPNGPTCFRISLMKKKEFLNKFIWQCIFPESHIFEVRIDATLEAPKLIFLTGGSSESKWDTKFVFGTWYNFGICLMPPTGGKGYTIDLYTSEGNEDLALTKSEEMSGELPKSHEYHYGALTLSNDGSEPKMKPTGQDVFSYSGISVTDEVPTGGGGSSAGAKPKSKGTEAGDYASPAPEAQETEDGSSTSPAPEAQETEDGSSTSPAPEGQEAPSTFIETLAAPPAEDTKTETDNSPVAAPEGPVSEAPTVELSVKDSSNRCVRKRDR